MFIAYYIEIKTSNNFNNVPNATIYLFVHNMYACTFTAV